MKLATVRLSGQTTWGVVDNDEFLDVGARLADQYPDLKAAVAGGLDGVSEAAGEADRHSLDTIEWLPVIPNPDKIFCVGLNYETHRKETGRAEVAHPTIFVRYANSQTGHLAPIVRPKVSEKLDFEGELAIVIGKRGRYIAYEDALDHIAGYACYNDGSVRDFQWHTHQFTPGKNFPDTGAFGPWMVSSDAMGPLDKLKIQTRLNDEVVQEALFEQMIFDVARQIEYCSTFTQLEPGDVIVTGTPGGVGAKREPPLWMKAGDTVEVEIEGVGTLRNPIVDENA